MATELKLQLHWAGRNWDSIEAGLRALSQATGAGVKRLSPFLRRELKDFLDTVALAMAQRHSAAWAPNARGPVGANNGLLYKRSGKLLRAIRSSVRIEGSARWDEGMAGFIGTKNLPYGSIHEYGGVIKPRKAQYLCVPLPDALDSRGVPKRKSPREWANTFVLKSKKGNLLIVQKRGKTKLVPLYMLVKQVKIPARLGLGKTLEVGSRYFRDHLAETLLDQIAAGIDKAAAEGV